MFGKDLERTMLQRYDFDSLEDGVPAEISQVTKLLAKSYLPKGMSEQTWHHHLPNCHWLRISLASCECFARKKSKLRAGGKAMMECFKFGLVTNHHSQHSCHALVSESKYVQPCEAFSQLSDVLCRLPTMVRFNWMWIKATELAPAATMKKLGQAWLQSTSGSKQDKSKAWNW